MKKMIFTFLTLSLSMFSKAQDTTMVEQYCNLMIGNNMFSNKVYIVIDYGKEALKWNKNYTVKDEQTGKAKEFNSVIDALNYMGKQGWTLVNAFPVSYSGATVTQPGTNTFHYFFKKLFKRSKID